MLNGDASVFLAFFRLFKTNLQKKHWNTLRYVGYERKSDGIRARRNLERMLLTLNCALAKSISPTKKRILCRALTVQSAPLGQSLSGTPFASFWLPASNKCSCQQVLAKIRANFSVLTFRVKLIVVSAKPATSLSDKCFVHS